MFLTHIVGLQQWKAISAVAYGVDCGTDSLPRSPNDMRVLWGRWVYSKQPNHSPVQ